MANSATSDCARVRTLNDLLRRHRIGGQVVLTPGVLALGLDLLMLIDDAVSRFEAFTPDNDPYGEHDFGLVPRCCRDPTGSTRGPSEVAGQPSV